MKVSVSTRWLSYEPQPGRPGTWSIEQDAVIITCPAGHEMGVLGAHYDRHALMEDGRIDQSVKCPAEGCDFHQHVGLREVEERLAEARLSPMRHWSVIAPVVRV